MGEYLESANTILFTSSVRNIKIKILVRFIGFWIIKKVIPFSVTIGANKNNHFHHPDSYRD
jgi:hypothetical protein